MTLPLTGYLLDRCGWGAWYPVMVLFGLTGGCAMLLVMRKQQLIARHTAG